MAPQPPAHPYIPNSAPGVRAEMMRQLGIKTIDELFSDIPEHLRLNRPLGLPGPMAELEVARHAREVLAANRPAGDGLLSFLGGGCWQHFIPAVCDEIAARGEFLTAYTGDTYEDHGRWQALFEFASLLGELLDMDMVSTPTYDSGPSRRHGDAHGGAGDGPPRGVGTGAHEPGPAGDRSFILAPSNDRAYLRRGPGRPDLAGLPPWLTDRRNRRRLPGDPIVPGHHPGRR